MSGFADLPSAWHSGGCRGAGQSERRCGTYPGAGSLVKEACFEWSLNQPLATLAPYAPHCPFWRKSPLAWLAMTSGECRVETGCRAEIALDGSQDSWALACPALSRMSRVTFRNQAPLRAPTVPCIKQGVHPSIALTSFAIKRLLAK